MLLTARAIAIEDEQRDVARALAIEATRLAPDLVPAAELAGRLLAEAGERRKAGKIIEAAWKASPHPDLAEAYAHVRLSDSARDRLARMQALARMAPDHAEAALAVARAALDAREFAAARAALEPLAEEPTQRVAMLMAELERARRRRGPRARMDGPRAQRGARSGLDRGRHRVGALAAGVAGDRAARCIPVEGAGRRHRRKNAGADRGDARNRLAAARRAPRRENGAEPRRPPFRRQLPDQARLRPRGRPRSSR